MVSGLTVMPVRYTRVDERPTANSTGSITTAIFTRLVKPDEQPDGHADEGDPGQHGPVVGEVLEQADADDGEARRGWR